MNLANLGLSAMTAAMARMQTTGHNINNADTEGFNRQRVIVSSAGAQNMGVGYIGRGVMVNSVERAYDNFLYRQLVSAQSTGASLVSYGSEISQINNLFSDRSVGVSPALQKFFDGIQAVASKPNDAAARQEMLGRAASLVGQINGANDFLQSQRENLNTQITTTVTQINSYLERINDLNQQIITAKAASPDQPPNDLYDQREQLASELSQLAGVRVIDQDGSYNITIGNGQLLLGGKTVFPLAAKASDADPMRTVVAYTVSWNGADPVLKELPDTSITGGSLGGLLRYRNEALDAVQNDLGRLAAGLAVTINEQHEQGFDINGGPGQAFFKLDDPKVISTLGNTGSAEITTGFTDVSKLTARDYKVVAQDVAGDITYVVTRVPDGSTVATSVPPATGIEFDGVSFEVTGGTAADGDSWLVQPTRATAGSLKLALNSADQIAAAATDIGDADNGNALKLAQLQTEKVLGNGTMSLNEAFSQIVNKTGVLTQQNGTAAKAQATLIQQNYAAQQSVSGVNLNEEYVNLQRYQEQFQAAARLIDTSSKMFDTLLGLRP